MEAMATASRAAKIATTTIGIRSHPLEWRKVWDAVTLGKPKWYLALAWFICWVVAKIVAELLYVIPNSYLWPKAMQFWPKDVYYWNNSGYLPQYPRIFFWWNYVWADSDLFLQLGCVVAIILVLLFLAAHVRERQTIVQKP
jgi:hypothetical protein